MKKQVREGEKHLAASAIIITDTTPKKALLIHHKKHNTWFQPGGHVEELENPIEAVVREVKEETNIDISFLKDSIQKMDNASVLPVPDFFLEEVIPAHGDEPSHFHLDMLYVIRVPFQEVQRQIEESNDIGWFTLEEAMQLPLFDNTKMMLEKALK